MARSWNDLPVGRVVHVGEDAGAVALALEPLPDDAPALVAYAPRPARTPADLVADVLGELETAAVAMFPAWLPDADGITGAGGAAVPAVRALALRTASTTRHFAHFLAHLAERALREQAGANGVTAGDRTVGRTGPFPPEVRAAGLARVLRDGYRRPEAAILVRPSSGLSPAAEEVLVTGCEWLAQHGRFGVWLTGPPLRAVDRVESMTAPIPDEVAALARELASPGPAAGGGEDPGSPVRPAGRRPAPVLTYPPLAGLPHPASEAERRLEKALSSCTWAAGRAWNQTHRSGPLTTPIRVDLLFRAERCVVEIDGPEHREALRLAADRQRDRRLREDGYAVRRFTNDQVLGHVGTVLAEIEHFLHTRRNGTFEGSPHA
ncbi:DUF559 domain-containing protein [Microbispora triticiradicis]|uniref:DUF559 domain-containing protein n=1 Tax=Microbispora triticiradicis TaxID=2200763 RepID=A0ABX9LVF1_9ACTN|nr:DUF559 domain-containing protein [Microbispora triticiradicis]RGA06929.1 DUF559 domain-containing protein [Microbispora triticiradicis]